MTEGHRGDGMIISYNKNLKPFSQFLRSNQTTCENRLWDRIRRRQILNTQFYRQKPIGCFIVDFYCKSHKIAIELDGSQHQLPNHKENDKNRDYYLQSLGITVLRFDNLSILNNLDGVLQIIYDAIITKPSPR